MTEEQEQEQESRILGVRMIISISTLQLKLESIIKLSLSMIDEFSNQNCFGHNHDGHQWI